MTIPRNKRKGKKKNQVNPIGRPRSRPTRTRKKKLVPRRRRQLSVLKQIKLLKLLVQHDPKYKNRLVTLAILRVLQSGKKSLAKKIVYKTLRLSKTQYRQRSSLFTFSSAVNRATPRFGTKKRRVRKKMFHSPINIKFFRGTKLSVRWVVESARLRRARTMARRLALELLDARKSMGRAFRKKQALHKLADAHRAFKRKKKKWWNRPSVPSRGRVRSKPGKPPVREINPVKGITLGKRNKP